MASKHTGRFQTTAKHAGNDSQVHNILVSPGRVIDENSASHLPTWPRESIRAAAVVVLSITAVQCLRLFQHDTITPVSPTEICPSPILVEPDEVVVCARSGPGPSTSLPTCCGQSLDRLRPGDRVTCLNIPTTCRWMRSRMPSAMLSLLHVPIDPNTATRQDLESLPGIGPGLARAILDYRRGKGPFPTIRALLAVPGVGPKTLAAIRPRLSLSQRKE